MQWFSVLLQILLLIVGTFLSDGYKNSLYFYWLIVVAFLIIASQILILKNSSLNEHLSDYKNKVSKLTTLKGNSDQSTQITVFPENKLVSGKETKIEIFISSTISMDSKPDIKLKTDNKCEVTLSSQVQKSSYFGGFYEIVLFNPDIDIKDEKFLKTHMYVKFFEKGNHNISLEIKGDYIESSLNTSFTVH